MNTFAFRPGTNARYCYFVLLHTDEPPGAEIWSQYVEALAARIATATSTINIFAVTDGGGPDPGQRRALARAFAPDQLGSITHVFTTSTVTRGIVTAFHWLARARALAHTPEEFPAVCERCHVPAGAVLEDLVRLQAELPPVSLLEQIDRAVRSCSVRPGTRRND
ncbi:MAG TPA: hypothetical protein VFS67_23510 [Polyangiaceae bacterium]|jgi:hypothetical protein|nr:hypothetical protein [Polyangiaceae bacterium]